MEGLTAIRLCSITILLGAALLPAPRSTQALSNTRKKDLALVNRIIKAMELPEDEISKEAEPGVQIFSSSAWAQYAPPQVQVEPEEDHDHLYHPQDNAREADTREPPQILSFQVQSGPEEDLDHLHHS